MYHKAPQKSHKIFKAKEYLYSSVPINCTNANLSNKEVYGLSLLLSAVFLILFFIVAK